jgi:RNA polymerase sigma-70 factor (ECF subfamily)
MKADSAKNSVEVGSRHVDVRAESKIVEAARNGDVDSFGRLYGSYYASMVWVAYSILGERDLAEDAAQETFALACHELVHRKRAEKFARWLAAICRNVARRMAKQRKRYVLTNDAQVIAEQNNENVLDETVREAIDGLAEAYRQALILRYYNDMSYEQMASALGESRCSVSSSLGKELLPQIRLDENLDR